MLNKDEFVRRILDGAPAAPAKAKPESGTALPEGFEGFDGEDESEGFPRDTRFAQLLIEECGFGQGEILPRRQAVLGEQRSDRFLPDRVTYWKKTTDRPFHILLFDIESTATEILANQFFRRYDQLEDALHRIVQDALNGFERGGEDRAADARQGNQMETLCVVSVADDQREGQPRQIVCFGTKCAATNALEVFMLREEARDWDRPLAEEHLSQLFERHIKKLGTGAKWQDAFVSGSERKMANKLLEACSGFISDKRVLQKSVGDLLDEIAGSFGLRRKGGNDGKRLMMQELPDNHSIAANPEDARAKGFKNPFQGLRIFDADERLIGYIVYVLECKTKAEQLRQQLEKNNHFHNVLVVYPDQVGASLELWQGTEPFRGRLISGSRRSRFDGDGGVVQLLSRFFVVSRSEIKAPKQLATELALRAQHLRELAKDELQKERSRPEDLRPLQNLRGAFNQALTTLDETAFADAYAQTITYGLLAARWMSSSRNDIRFTRKNINRLLPSTSPFLRDLFERLINSRFDKNVSWLLDDITSLLSRTMVADVFEDDKDDPSIHFYQDFLDVYDPKIRKERGVYYTPDEIVTHIVRTAHSALQKMGLQRGLADTRTWSEFAVGSSIPVPDGVDGNEPFVQILDPATGTGTFLLRAVEVIHETMMNEFENRGLDCKACRQEWVKYVRQHLLPRINGFELMMAPYIVSHLRLGLALQQTGFEFKDQDRLQIFLTNTLEMHTVTQLSWIGEHVAQEALEAERIKNDAPISVIVGNPPYEREPARRADNHKGGWIRSGWDGWESGRPPLDDYVDPAKKAGNGLHVANLYNLYVYFWRWASWRVFDRFGAPGVVSFVTPSSFLLGPGFSGMREEFRRTASEIFILDLEGDSIGARVSENVFNIRIPVCICSTFLFPKPSRTHAAATHYARITGSREEKLQSVGRCSLSNTSLIASPSGWQDVLVAVDSVGGYSLWPMLVDIFPWTHTGSNFERTWPIAENIEVLRRRWEAFLSSKDRATLFVENRDRKVDRTYQPLFVNERPLPPLSKLANSASIPRIERISLRSFQRAYCFADNRIGTTIKPVLWNIATNRQVFLTSLLTGVLGDGPAATVAAFVPEKHHFCGRGSKDVLPLWRDPDRLVPNLTNGVVEALEEVLGLRTKPEDFFAYVYATLASPEFVRRFRAELQVPGLRVPLTRVGELFIRGVELGRELIKWHTYGERFVGENGAYDGFELEGRPSVITPISSSPESYPKGYDYDESSCVLHVGSGAIGPVRPEVWGFSVSGLQVVRSWVGSRMRDGTGKKSSLLDEIRPEQWTDQMTQELLELLWVLSWTVEKYPEVDAWLHDVLASDLFTSDDVPKPSAGERIPPRIRRGGKILPFGSEVGSHTRANLRVKERTQSAANPAHRRSRKISEEQRKRRSLSSSKRVEVNIDDVEASLGWIRVVVHGETGAQGIDREQLIRRMVKCAGFERVSAKTRSKVDGLLSAAARRGIAYSEDGTIVPDCGSISDYKKSDLDKLVLAATGRSWIDRSEAIRAAARYLGFLRAGPKIKIEVEAAFRRLQRSKRLERDRSRLRRI